MGQSIEKSPQQPVCRGGTTPAPGGEWQRWTSVELGDGCEGAASSGEDGAKEGGGRGPSLDGQPDVALRARTCTRKRTYQKKCRKG